MINGTADNATYFIEISMIDVKASQILPEINLLLDNADEHNSRILKQNWVTDRAKFRQTSQFKWLACVLFGQLLCVDVELTQKTGFVHYKHYALDNDLHTVSFIFAWFHNKLNSHGVVYDS